MEVEKPSRRRTLVKAALTAYTVVVALAFCWYLHHLVLTPKNGVRVEALEADMDARLPVGSTRERALEWFALQGAKSYAVHGNDGCEALFALVPNDTLFDLAEIKVYVHLDANGRVKERTVRRVIYSP